MSLSNTAFERILKEYDEKQLAVKRDLRLRTEKIEQEIPELTEINSHIAALSVDMAVQRIKGKTQGENNASLEAYRAEKEALISRREELLKRHGYSHEDLEPHYVCSLCQDTGYVNGEKCRCLKNRIVELMYDQSNIREILKRENFSSYSFRYYSSVPLSPHSDESPLTIAKKAVAIAHDFVHFFPTSSGNLFITGETGTGKTFLCNCIAKDLLDQGYYIIYLSAVKLFGILADSTFHNNREQEQLSEDLLSCDLLIIDDLGTEFTTVFIQSAFFNCVNERLLRKKHTIISTNLSIEQIRDNYSERVFSRIAERYTMVRLFGEDIRIIKKMEE